MHLTVYLNISVTVDMGEPASTAETTRETLKFVFQPPHVTVSPMPPEFTHTHNKQIIN